MEYVKSIGGLPKKHLEIIGKRDWLPPFHYVYEVY